LKAKKKEHGDSMIRRITIEQEKSLNLLDIIMVRNDMKKKHMKVANIDHTIDHTIDPEQSTEPGSIDENKQRELLKNKRGKNEDKWEIIDEKIPAEYSRYIEEDMMNNRLMERLNSEIDFRINDNLIDSMSKPYDDHHTYDAKTETIDTFAKFDKTSGKILKTKKF